MAIQFWASIESPLPIETQQGLVQRFKSRRGTVESAEYQPTCKSAQQTIALCTAN